MSQDTSVKRPLKRKFRIGQVVYNLSNLSYQRIINVIRDEDDGQFIYVTGGAWFYKAKLLRPLNRREIGR